MSYTKELPIDAPQFLSFLQATSAYAMAIQQGQGVIALRFYFIHVKEQRFFSFLMRWVQKELSPDQPIQTSRRGGEGSAFDFAVM